MYAIRSYYETNTLDKDSESRLNLLMTFQEFKELKSIDRESMMKILEDVMHAALAKKFGPEAVFVITSYSIHYTKLYEKPCCI